MKKLEVFFVASGIICTLVSIYQLVELGLASFYTLFSVGMTLTLFCVHSVLAGRRLFTGWNLLAFGAFWIVLVLASVLVDVIGIKAGYWEYPHYGRSDQVRKYIFEWAVALFYHFLALIIGVQVFKKLGVRETAAYIYSYLIFVTAIGFITESLNLVVYSWRVTSMPITNLQIGNYFLVFQTIGYWLMALIPYVIYRSVESIFAVQPQRELR